MGTRTLHLQKLRFLDNCPVDLQNAISSHRSRVQQESILPPVAKSLCQLGPHVIKRTAFWWRCVVIPAAGAASKVVFA